MSRHRSSPQAHNELPILSSSRMYYLQPRRRDPIVQVLGLQVAVLAACQPFQDVDQAGLAWLKASCKGGVGTSRASHAVDPA